MVSGTGFIKTGKTDPTSDETFARNLALPVPPILSNWTILEAAKRYYRALAGLAINGDGQRPELAEAKTYLAQN